MGKESRIRKYRKVFKELAPTVASEKNISVKELAQAMWRKAENKEHAKAIRFFKKERQ